MTWIGWPIEFGVATTGSLPIGFQWFFNGTDAVAGGTNAVLRIGNPQMGDLQRGQPIV
jgi:hypothetical protein